MGADRAPGSSGSLAPPWARAVALIAAAATGLTGALVWNPRRPGDVDAWASRVLTVSRHSVSYRFASRLDDTARTLPVLTVSLAIAVIAWVLLRRWDVVVAACAVAPATAAVEALVKLAARRSLGLGSFSYPSGRTALATCLVLMLVLVLRAADVRPLVRAVVAVVGSFYVLLMAWARVATSQHLLSDVVGGVCVGVAVTLAIVLVVAAAGRPPR